MSFSALREFFQREKTEHQLAVVAKQISHDPAPMPRYLTPSMICRYMISLVRANLDPGMLQRGEYPSHVVLDGLIERHIQFDAGDLSQSLDDYAEYVMLPHAVGFAALLKMANAWRVFDLPLPAKQVGCRHSFDGLSMRMLVLPGNIFRFDMLFQPRAFKAKTLVEYARIGPELVG